jgi:hypothetical protein
VICAERWLVDHRKVFNDGKATVNEKNIVVREGYGYVGPHLCDPAVASDCLLIDPFLSEPCGSGALKQYCRHPAWVPVGETEGGDNTLRIISDGGLQAAQWLQRQLGLAPISARASKKSTSASVTVENRP